MNILKSLLSGAFAVSICIVQGCSNSNTVKDIDGNAYKTVKIGNQVWMAENLRTTKYNDGSSIPEIKNSIRHLGYGYSCPEWYIDHKGAYCFYKNTIDKDSINKFGALYNWYAVNTGKLAMKGWHVPTAAEWDTLQNYLIANGYNWDGTTTGNKIGKSLAAKKYWDKSEENGSYGNNLAKNNRSGFSAFPMVFVRETLKTA